MKSLIFVFFSLCISIFIVFIILTAPMDDSSLFSWRSLGRVEEGTTLFFKYRYICIQGGCWAAIQIYSEAWIKCLSVGLALLVQYICLR